MEDNRNLELYIEQFKRDCNVWLEKEKEESKKWLNEKLLQYIKNAEEEIVKGQEGHIQRFKKQMEDLEQKRSSETSSLMEDLYNRMEESNKKMFELSMKGTQDIWQNLIERCKKEMK